MKRSTFFRSIALIFGFLISTIAFSIPPNPPAGGGAAGGGGNGPPCWPPPCIPIDGGISFLILAGAAYGGKKAYDFRKKKSEQA